MDSIYLEIIILVLLVYVIDKKIFPQILIMFLTLSILIHEITIATDLKNQIGIFILFAGIIVYSALQVSLKGDNEV